MRLLADRALGALLQAAELQRRATLAEVGLALMLNHRAHADSGFARVALLISFAT